MTPKCGPEKKRLERMGFKAAETAYPEATRIAYA
jgi:hypothetical protein